MITHYATVITEQAPYLLLRSYSFCVSN